MSELLRGGAPEHKLIDGHWYVYYGSYWTRNVAKDVASGLRSTKSNTTKARVVLGSGGIKSYHVYTRTLREGISRRER